jgi:hypothetical protein
MLQRMITRALCVQVHTSANGYLVEVSANAAMRQVQSFRWVELHTLRFPLSPNVTLSVVAYNLHRFVSLSMASTGLY